MKYKVIDDILPRFDNNNSAHLQYLSKIIDEAIDFGTNLLKWEAGKKLEGDANLVHLLFFRNILSTADGISILIKNSSIEASKPLYRVLMENVFALEYLLQENTKSRALAYFVWDAHKTLKFIEKIDFSTETGKQLKSDFAKDRFAKNTVFTDSAKYLDQKKNAEELLKLPDYIDIELEFQKTHAKKKNPNWFTLFNGPEDIEQLAARVNLNALYQIHYRSYSANIHSTNVHKGKLYDNGDGTVDIIQIRYAKDSTAVAADTLNLLLLSFITFYQKRLPEKKDDFQNWYFEFRIEYLKILEAVKNA
ncbi:DUF5677 domain-containing protein [Flavobacterium panici]|uniref:Uncharacterized protein n=1 Tax=Flavobacterium panici TaxID=2654843 RepID=A0A9N8J1C9_9FLAO|nr:DUF5677 domain-containing protein [Flavobacterium panici]CAC9974440.1 hypothetical protein FLAPXU55_02137 [Flavobacterium panici]